MKYINQNEIYRSMNQKEIHRSITMRGVLISPNPNPKVLDGVDYFNPAEDNAHKMGLYNKNTLGTRYYGTGGGTEGVCSFVAHALAHGRVALAVPHLFDGVVVDVAKHGGVVAAHGHVAVRIVDLEVGPGIFADEFFHTVSPMRSMTGWKRSRVVAENRLKPSRQGSAESRR